MDSHTPQQIIDLISNALGAALYAEDSWEGVECARDALAGVDFTSLRVRPAALNCDGLYEPGYQLVMRTERGTFSGVACSALWPAVQVRHGDQLLLLSSFS